MLVFHFFSTETLFQKKKRNMGQSQSLLQVQLNDAARKKSADIADNIVEKLTESAFKGNTSIEFVFPKSDETPRLSDDVICIVQSILSQKGLYAGPAQDEYSENELFSGCGGSDVVTEYRYQRTKMHIFVNTPSIWTRLGFWRTGSFRNKPLVFTIHS
jgi:hypothetical protein